MPTLNLTAAEARAVEHLLDAYLRTEEVQEDLPLLRSSLEKLARLSWQDAPAPVAAHAGQDETGGTVCNYPRPHGRHLWQSSVCPGRPATPAVVPGGGEAV